MMRVLREDVMMPMRQDCDSGGSNGAVVAGNGGVASGVMVIDCLPADHRVTD